MQNIPFNQPSFVGREFDELLKLKMTQKLCGDGYYTKECERIINIHFNPSNALMVSSCTHALELGALLFNVSPGDEIIMPSYTFVSTANAFVLRGARIVFVDVNPDTMNMNEKLLEKAISKNTKAIVPVHYAGWSCDMDYLSQFAKNNNLLVLEDAAQAYGATYKGKRLGAFGDLSAFSFHETKNITSGGEGGALIVNNENLLDRAHIIREKGTNRRAFINGSVDKYSWVDVGSSYLMSELQAAYLINQLEMYKEINLKRIQIWKNYFDCLKKYHDQKLIELPLVPEYSEINGHIFYLKLKDENTRVLFQQFMKDNGIQTTFHYVPLHLSEFGKNCSRFVFTEVDYTLSDSKRLVRLPIFYNMNNEQVEYVIKSVINFLESL